MTRDDAVTDDALDAGRVPRWKVVGPGLVVAATISRYASLYDTLARGSYAEPEVRRIVAADLATGVHRPFRRDLFTDAYFHHPDDVPGEFAEAGLSGAERYAVEGAAWLFADRDGWLEGDERTDALLGALRDVEREPAMFGISSHLLTVSAVS